MSATGPIVVVGGGIVGASLAFHLREADRGVVLLERGDLLGGGTTRESIAMLGINYPSPIEWRRYSRDHYLDLVEAGEIEFTRTGGLLVRETAEGFDELERTAGDLEALGHDSAILEPDEVADFGVHPPKESRTLHIPDTGYLDPSGIIAHWMGTAREATVDVRTETPVTDVTVRGDAVTGVETPDGSIATDTVVNAAGPWAPGLNTLAGVEAPLRHNYGPILVLDVDAELSLPFVAFPNRQYFREEGRTNAFAGRRGVDYAEAERRDPDRARQVPEAFRLAVEKRVTESIPALAEAVVINEWMGMRTITPDALPLVGETTVDGFSLACGLSGKGITLAPAIGRDLAHQLTAGETTPALAEVSPARFDG